MSFDASLRFDALGQRRWGAEGMRLGDVVLALRVALLGAGGSESGAVCGGSSSGVRISGNTGVLRVVAGLLSSCCVD